jgi:antitoxin component YwqK of YwqJK toxin-antitoxin module
MIVFDFSENLDIENNIEFITWFEANFPNGAKIKDVITKLENIKTTTLWIDGIAVTYKLTLCAKTWYENEQIKYETNYKNGRRHGTAKCWYDNGKLTYARKYMNGKRHIVPKGWDKLEKEIEEIKNKEEKK